MTDDFDFFPEERDSRAADNAISRPPRHLLVFALAIAAAAVAVVWLLTARGSSVHPQATSSSAIVAGGPAIVSEAQLVRFASSLDFPVYWTGPHAGYSYELTSAQGRVWVRYLPAGVKAGDPRAGFLVVGTYERPHAYADLKRAARHPGTVSKAVAGGGLLVYNAQRPTSAYFSYPGAKYQVEVYAPSAGTARAVVLQGKITPIR